MFLPRALCCFLFSHTLLMIVETMSLWPWNLLLQVHAIRNIDFQSVHLINNNILIFAIKNEVFGKQMHVFGIAVILVV